MAKTWIIDEPITPAEMTRIEADIERALDDAAESIAANDDMEILLWMGVV